MLVKIPMNGEIVTENIHENNFQINILDNRKEGNMRLRANGDINTVKNSSVIWQLSQSHMDYKVFFFLGEPLFS